MKNTDNVNPADLMHCSIPELKKLEAELQSRYKVKDLVELTVATLRSVESLHNATLSMDHMSIEDTATPPIPDDEIRKMADSILDIYAEDTREIIDVCCDVWDDLSWSSMS